MRQETGTPSPIDGKRNMFHSINLNGAKQPDQISQSNPSSSFETGRVHFTWPFSVHVDVTGVPSPFRRLFELIFFFFFFFFGREEGFVLFCFIPLIICRDEAYLLGLSSVLFQTLSPPQLENNRIDISVWFCVVFDLSAVLIIISSNFIIESMEPCFHDSLSVTE